MQHTFVLPTNPNLEAKPISFVRNLYVFVNKLTCFAVSLRDIIHKTGFAYFGICK